MIELAAIAIAFFGLVFAFWAVVGSWIRVITGRDVMDRFRPSAYDVARAERFLGVRRR